MKGLGWGVTGGGVKEEGRPMGAKGGGRAFTIVEPCDQTVGLRRISGSRKNAFIRNKCFLVRFRANISSPPHCCSV